VIPFQAGCSLRRPLRSILWTAQGLLANRRRGRLSVNELCEGQGKPNITDSLE
jgi:hypothetical protein